MGVSVVGYDEVPELGSGGFVNHKCPARVATAYALMAQHISR